MSGTTPSPSVVEAAVRAEDAGRVRDLLRDATEEDRRALATALKPLLDGPPFDLPEPVIFDSAREGMAFIFGQMSSSAAGQEAEDPPHPRQEWFQLSQTPAFAALAVGVAGGRVKADRALEDCHGRDWHVSDAEWDAIAGVLADRQPSWLAELIDARLRGLSPRHVGVAAWPLARRLILLGAIERPALPEYVAVMVGALTQEPLMSPSPPELHGELFAPPGYDGPRPEMLGTGGDRLARVLLAQPDLLEHEVWRLFTDPGVGKEMDGTRFITSWERLVAGDQWAEALAALSAAGHLDRGRLLDACLDAFLRDFPPNHVGWYAGFHDALAPSLAEKGARGGRYLALLSAAGKPGVSLGQRVSGELMDAGLLDAAAFLAASVPALAHPQKSVATAQLKLIGALAAASPPARAAGLATAAQAFAHPREDVQAAALKLIARHGLPADPAARATVTGLAASLSPVLQPEATALGLIQPADPNPASPVTTPAPALPSPVTAVTDPAELVSLLARLMEDASDALAVERALAGAVRLAGLPLDERAELAGPLLKRARTRAEEDHDGPFSGHKIRSDMAWLTLTWGTGEPPRATSADPPSPGDMRDAMAALVAGRGGIVGQILERIAPARPASDEYRDEYSDADAGDFDEARSQFDRRAREEVSRSGEPLTMAGILSARIWEACALIAAGHAVPLLAEPQFTDGSLTHPELVDRLGRWPAGKLAPSRTDLEVALLRLPPGADVLLPAAREAYLAGLAELSFEPYITDPRVTFHDRPWGTEAVTAGYTQVRARLAGPAPQAHGSRCWGLLTDLSPGGHRRHDREALRWSLVYVDEIVAAWPLLAPHQPELIAAHLLSPLSDGLESGVSAAGTALRALAGMRGPAGIIGHLALVTGLASSQSDTRIAAAQAWCRLAGDDRLDPALAAAAITFGVTGAAVKLSRVADGLRHAVPDAAAAPGLARACLLAAASLLEAPELAGTRPAGLHLLLELAAQASAGHQTPAIPEPVRLLASEKASTKLVQAARRLMLLSP